MSEKIKVRVYQSGYGCETGCCGHIVELTMPDGTEKECRFDFDHPSREKDFKAWALKMARSNIGREFPECINSIDWDSLEFAGVSDD